MPHEGTYGLRRGPEFQGKRKKKKRRKDFPSETQKPGQRRMAEDEFFGQAAKTSEFRPGIRRRKGPKFRGGR